MTPRALPLLSVIIPTRNRPRQIRACLDSLAEQTYPRERWEVIVVIDGEDDALLNALPEWSGRLPLRWFEQAHAGCGIARNTGASEAHGQFLIFTDDDCLFPADWLSRFEEQFQQRPEALIAGRSLNAVTGNSYSQATQDLIDYLHSRLNAEPERAVFGVGNNLGAPRDGFLELEGFSPIYYRMAAEDRDFCSRWRRAGRPMIYAAGVVVHHAHELSLQTFLEQHVHYGRGARLFHRLEASRDEGRAGIDVAGFYFSLLLWPWRICSGFAAIRLFLLFVGSQAAQTFGYLRIR